MLETNKQLVIEKCKQVFAKAQALYGLNMSNVKILFTLRGRCAGMASHYCGQYSINFNTDMMKREAFDHIINNTVPHEIGHIVCFMDRSLGHNHNSGWEHVVKQLGGSGARRHTEEVVYGKGATYEYVTSKGETVRVSEQRHKSIMAGTTLTYREKGTINKTSPCSIVGRTGVTLAKPQVIRGVNDPKIAGNTPVVQRATPRTLPVDEPLPTIFTGKENNTTISKAIILSGKSGGKSYNEIIVVLMAVCKYSQDMAREVYIATVNKMALA